MLVILSIRKMANMPLQFFLISARTFFSLHPIFLPRKKACGKENVWADISLEATSNLVRQLKWWLSNNLLHKSVVSNQLCPLIAGIPSHHDLSIRTVYWGCSAMCVMADLYLIFYGYHIYFLRFISYMKILSWSGNIF